MPNKTLAISVLELAEMESHLLASLPNMRQTIQMLLRTHQEQA